MQLQQDEPASRMGYSVTEAADMLGIGTIRTLEVDRTRQNPLGEDRQSADHQRP